MTCGPRTSCSIVKLPTHTRCGVYEILKSTPPKRAFRMGLITTVLVPIYYLSSCLPFRYWNIHSCVRPHPICVPVFNFGWQLYTTFKWDSTHEATSFIKMYRPRHLSCRGTKEGGEIWHDMGMEWGWGWSTAGDFSKNTIQKSSRYVSYWIY